MQDSISNTSDNGQRPPTDLAEVVAQANQMAKKTDSDPESPPKSATTDMLDYVQRYEIQIPKLSMGGLESLAFAHYDALKGKGAPTALEISKRFTSGGSCSSKEQASNARRARDWINRRQVEYLRTKIAELNPQLVELAVKTKSRDVREGVIYKIYSAIGKTYPGLAQTASEARIRQMRRLAEINQDGAPASSAAKQPLSPTSEPTAPRVTLALAKEQAADSGVADMYQIANTQFHALLVINEYLVPLAKIYGISIDAVQASGLVQNLLIQSYYQRTHQKFPRTKLEDAR